MDIERLKAAKKRAGGGNFENFLYMHFPLFGS